MKNPALVIIDMQNDVVDKMVESGRKKLEELILE